jgi:hypothetical protein
MIIHATKGTPVRFWTGLREGEGRVGELSYDGVHEIGGSWSVYIKGIGSVVLSHVEELTIPAAEKPVKVHEFTQEALTAPGEHVLCAVVIGPDRDDPTRKTLHLRSYAAAVEILHQASPATRGMIADHLARLIGEFKNLLEVA